MSDVIFGKICRRFWPFRRVSIIYLLRNSFAWCVNIKWFNYLRSLQDSHSYTGSNKHSIRYDLICGPTFTSCIRATDRFFGLFWPIYHFLSLLLVSLGLCSWWYCNTMTFKLPNTYHSWSRRNNVAPNCFVLWTL